MKKRKKGYIPLVKEEWKEEESIVKEEVPTWENTRKNVTCSLRDCVRRRHRCNIGN